MTTPAPSTWAPASKPGDRDALIVAAKNVLDNFSYGAAALLTEKIKGYGAEYTSGFGTALRQFQTNRNAEITQGKKPGPKMEAPGVFDWATKRQLGLIPSDTSTPTTGVPPAPVSGKRHPGWVFRGTGGVIGQDYVSKTIQGVADLVEEINTPWAATMGGIPVGTSGGIGDPSMWRAVNEAFDAFKNHPTDGFLARRAAKPNLKAVIGGYSAGAVVAAKCRQWVLDNYPENYLCSFSFGDPTRPNGGAFYRAPAAHREGQGIGSWRYGNVNDNRHCWLTNVADPAKPDMYARVPLGKTGEIMEGAYNMVTQVEFSNLAATAQAILPAIPEIAADAGISVPGVLGALSGGLPGLLGFGGMMLIGALPGLIGGGNPDTLTGPAAAAAAARIGLTFALDQPPTKPHITYEFAQVWPGQTYLGLAIQHVRDYAKATAPV